MGWAYSPLLSGAAQQESGGVATEDADASSAGTGTVAGQAAAIASAAVDSAGAGATAATGASIASATAFAAGAATVEAEGASEEGNFEDAAISAAGVGEISGAAASIASAAASISGSAQGDAVGAFDGDAPQEELPAELPLGASGAAGALHPDLVAPKKRRKPRIIRLGESDSSPISAEAQAEADFRILWESVRIRDNPRRLEAVVQKRAAMLADLEQATLIRKIG